MIRLYNGLYLDTAEGFRPGEVWVDGAKIAYCGDGQNAPAQKPAGIREIDMRGDYLMPGFKNCHTHSAMTLFRGLAEELPLTEWLFEKIFPLEAKLTPDDVYWGTKLAIAEYLAGGTTAISDMYFFIEAVAAAVRESEFKCVAVGSVPTRNIAGEKQLEELSALYARYGKTDAHFMFRLGFHAEYTATAELLKGVAELSNAHKAPVFHHLCESRNEVAECVERTGMTPPAYLESFGLYEHGGAGYHCVNLSQGDISLLKKHKIAVVTCPMSNLKVASIAPVESYRRAGLTVALGTDGAASANTLDMFSEMRLLCALQKGTLNDSTVMPAGYGLNAAVSTGAKALGLDDCDEISAGKTADLCLVSADRPNMRPRNNPLYNVVYSARPENVRMTMVSGKILYYEGEYFINERVERVYSECEKIVKRINA